MSFGLPYQGVLELGLRIDIGEAGLGGFDIGLGLRKACAVVPIVDPEQDVAGTNGLVVLNLYGRDVARNLRRERGHVAANIGVVGERLVRTGIDPSASHDHDGAEAQQQADRLLLVKMHHDTLLQQLFSLKRPLTHPGLPCGPAAVDRDCGAHDLVRRSRAQKSDGAAKLRRRGEVEREVELQKGFG